MLEVLVKVLFLFTFAAAPRHVEHEVVFPEDVELAAPEVAAPAEIELQKELGVDPKDLLQIEFRVGKVIRVDGKELDMAGLEALLVEKKKADADLGVALNADRDLPFEDVQKLLELFEKVGVEEVMLVAKAKQ